MTDNTYSTNNKKTTFEINSKTTSNFTKNSNKENTPKAQDITDMIAKISKKEDEKQ